MGSAFMEKRWVQYCASLLIPLLLSNILLRLLVSHLIHIINFVIDDKRQLNDPSLMAAF